MKEGVSIRNTALILIACVVVLAGLKLAHQVVVPFMLAVFIATIASTPIQWLTRRKCPHWLAVVTVLVVLVVALFGLGLVFLQVVKEFQAEQTFYQDQIRDLTEDTINPIINTLFPDSDLDFSAILDPSRVIPLASQALQSIGQLLSNTFLIFLTVLFILAEGKQLPRKLRGVLLERKMDVRWLDQFGENLNRYIAVKTCTSLLTGVCVTVLLLVLGVDFAILWGLLAFMLNYIPNIGSAIAAAPAILVTVVSLGWGSAALVLMGYVGINVGIGAGIEPRFLGRTLGLSTLVVFLSLIFWGWMFGPVGMLLSVPLTMTAILAFEAHESTAWIAHLLEPNRPDSEPSVPE
ncbi:MAG: AI-2E family transporter [Gammaproteobacteria bacterium]|nr:AI-2E family transporter [Gammaproteobacteria bacterium]